MDHQGQVQREAADIATNGSRDIQSAQNKALEAITEAVDDGFRVGEDLSVTDTRRADTSDMAARQTAATEHADDIRWNAERLVQADTHVGERLQAKAAELDGIRFEDEGRDNNPSVQLVGNRFKLNPQEDGDAGLEKKPNPKDPHATDPNRSADGTYGPRNSGDGKAAEKAALAKREEETGIPIIRQQVRATHPDVINPDTQKPQHRYFDGLQPTGNPDEYIGLEAKTNEASGRKDQERFDSAVSREHPATATLNGREIKIVGAQTVYPPDGWVPPSAQMAPGAGASAGEATVGIPDSVIDGGAGGFGGVQAEGTVPVTPTPAANYPGWGTQLTPQQMIDSGDPALIVAGQEIRRRMAEQGIVDPSGIA